VDRWRSKTFVVCPAPAFSKSGVAVQIAQSGDGWGMSDALNDDDGHTGEATRTMETTTIDEQCASCKALSGVPVNAIKIDVDGPDFEVLEGARDVVRQHRPLVLIENMGPPLRQFAEKESYELFTFFCEQSRPWEMTFRHLTAGESFDGMWSKMTLAVPSESAALLVSLDGCTRDNRDKTHLFREI
jgi:FkbM family methyltransferase